MPRRSKLTPALALLLATSSLNDTFGFTIQPPLNVLPTGGFTTQTPNNHHHHQQQFPLTILGMAQKRGRPRGPVRTIEVKPPMNAEIKFAQLRVTVPNTAPSASSNNVKDEVLGIMSREDALAKAKEMGGLDLILINENSDPPVAKIADYSKYRYEREKKAKEAKKNSKSTEMKEVKMSYKIDIHDYGVRIKNASKFINQGNRVKCTVQFKGREVQHDKLGFELLAKMADDMTTICTMDGKPKREGRSLICILSPRPQVTKALNDKKRSDEKARKKNKRESKEKDANASLGEAETEVVVEQVVEEPVVVEAKTAEIFIATLSDDDDDEDIDSSLKELLGTNDLADDLFA